MKSPPQTTPNTSQEVPKKNLPTIMMRSRPGTKRTAEAIGSSLPPKTYSEPSPVKEILIPGQPDEIPIKNELIAIPVQNIPIVQPTSAFDIKDEEEIDVTGMDFIDYGEMLTQVPIKTTANRNKLNSNARDMFTTRLNAVKHTASTSSSYQNSPIDVVNVDENPYEDSIESLAAKRAKMTTSRTPASPQKPQRSSTKASALPTPSYPTTSIRNVSLVDDDDDENFLKPIKITYLNEDGTEESEGLNGQFFCDKCPAMFRSRVGLTNHKKKHGANDMYRCNLCDFSCKNKKTTRYHRKVHMEIAGDGMGYEDDV